ncbi:MAG: VTC domain-containing protein [Eubacteriales bacterium]
MAKKKDIDIKSSSYFKKKRADKAQDSPEARAERRAQKAEERHAEAQAHIEAMLEEERKKKAEAKARKEQLWQEKGFAEKPRIQVKKGKTEFKPEALNRQKEKPQPKVETDEPLIAVERSDAPKVVITKKGEKPLEQTLELKKRDALFEDLVETPVIVREKAKLVKKSKPEPQPKKTDTLDKEALKALLAKDIVEAPKKREDDNTEALETIRPMLRTKGQEKPKYDDATLAAQAEAQDVHIRSLEAAGEKKPLAPRTPSRASRSLRADSEKVYRHELKYYISEADYQLLSAQLNRLLKHDENAGEDGDYYIRSLYFDDFKNSALVEKLAGVEKRKKYRIRIYGLKDDMIRLERKNKDKDYISKDSLRLTRAEYEKIIAEDLGFLLKKNNQLAKDFYYEVKTKRLKPMVIVDYVREAYVHPIKNLRITFDKTVKTGRNATDMFDDKVPLATVLKPGMVVMEVKFQHGLPDYLIAVLNNAKASQRSAISKYALCRKYEA